MSDNKVKGQLDFSNIKMSQFGMGNAIRASFSELQSGLRTVNTNPILKDAYTHFIQELDDNGNPTKVEYYQANEAVIDEIFFVDDVSGNLAGKYIVIQEFITKRELVFYIRVDGIGAVPSVGDLQVPVDIFTDDPASIVRIGFINAIKQYNSFEVERVGKYTETSIKVTYLQFGETEAIDLTDTGFTVNRIQSGDSFKVGQVSIEYDENQDPIWGDNLLKGFKFNPYLAEFQINSDPSSSKVLDAAATHKPSLRFDEVGDSIMYLGTADFGADTSEAVWQIKKIDTSSGVAITSASENYDQVWDNRASLTYV